MYKLPIALGLIFSLMANAACVRAKLYREELGSRNAAEAREEMLAKEMLDRKAEAEALVKQIGDLSHTVGNQETEIKQLNTELAARTQQMGASASKLLSEKTALEKDLAVKTSDLDVCLAVAERVRNAQQQRKEMLESIKTSLSKGYAGLPDVSLDIKDDAVLLTFPDKGLFDPGGVTITVPGKSLLKPLADLMATRPEVDAEVISYTDNALPKGKPYADTWEWSLQRATNLVRLLIREYNTNANQLTPIGKGEFYPLTSNETAEGRQKNRRTVIAFRPDLPAIPTVEK